MLLRSLERATGGSARLRVVAVLAAVLAVDSADKGTVGASSTSLQHSLSIGKTDIGLLLTVTGIVSALTTLPLGTLVDRLPRLRLLVVVIAGWAAVMAASSLAPTFGWLLGARALLGGLAAVAYPAVVSLVGDWFVPGERSAVLGLVLAGELVGTGFGLVAAGIASSLVSWRLAFALMALPAAGVAWAVHGVAEPARGGASRFEPRHDDTRAEPDADEVSVRALVEEQGIEPDPDLQLAERHLSLAGVVAYVLRIRTNVIVVASSALGYFMFAGVRAFGVEFAERHYGLRPGSATLILVVLGAAGVGGVVVGGRLADRLLARGHVRVRIGLPIVAYFAVVVCFAPAVVVTSLVVAVPLMAAAAFSLALANPPLDAARLDVVPPDLWGRAEAVRATLRTALEALAPLAFGAVAEHVFGGRTGVGLRDAFLVMLVPLFASPVVLLFALRSYPRDVASMAGSPE